MNHSFSRLSALLAMAATVAVPVSVQAETFTLRVGAGQPSAPIVYVNTIETFFVPEIEKRVAERTEHELNIIQAYGATVAKPAEVLEAVERGILDIGGFCACFEPVKALPFNLNYFIPFATANAEQQQQITRQVFDQFPEIEASLEQFNQRVLGVSSFDNYGLGTTFPWDDVTELAGHKIAGAGPNLPWLELSGATPVTTTLGDVYNALQSGIFEGILMFPASYNGFKFQEVAPHYKVIDIGAVTVNVLSVNLDTWERLPQDVRDIIAEVGREYEIQGGIQSDAKQAAGLEALRASEGTEVTSISPEQRQAWAESLKGFPNTRAQDFKEAGFDGPGIFRAYIETAKAAGVEFPVEYVIED